MYPITDGKTYVLESPDGKMLQTVQFLCDESNGTINEEMVKVLIHRLEHLHAKWPCRENVDAIAALKVALTFLCLRQQRVEKEAQADEA